MRSFLFLMLLVVPVFLLPACRSDVVVSPPDPRERYVSPFPAPLESYVAMNQPEVARSIVSGVSDDVVEGKRWAERRAVLRFHSIPLGELRFHAAFELPERLVQQAGAVTLKVLLDGELTQETEYTEPGPHEIEKKLTQGDVTWERETEVTLELSTPGDRRIPDADARYLISAAGFRF